MILDQLLAFDHDLPFEQFRSTTRSGCLLLPERPRLSEAIVHWAKTGHLLEAAQTGSCTSTLHDGDRMFWGPTTGW